MPFTETPIPRTIPEYPTSPVSASPTRGLISDAVLIGLAATLVGVLFSWVPSLWYDEAATVVSATRSWAALGRMLTTVDLVHATYYSSMHLWFEAVGYSPITLRLPSALATGGAAGLTVVLGRMLGTRRIGVFAGIAFCVLPRVTWMGLEGRSFALGTLFAVGSTVLFLMAWRRTTNGSRHSAWWWVAYTFVAILGCAVFIYLILVVLGHGVTVALAAIRERHDTAVSGPWWRPLARWVCAAAITGLSILPFAVQASGQSEQIHWILRPGRHTFEEVFTTQFFYENVPFAILAWALIIVGLLVARCSTKRGPRDVLLVAVPWMVVPTLGLIAVSLVHTPLYSPRYVTFATPAAALAIGVGLACLPWKPVVTVLVAGAVALSLPTIIAQRQVTAKDSSAWNQVAALVAQQRASEPSGAVEDVIYGPVDRHPLTTSRIIADTYPAAFRGLDDIQLKTPAAETNHMWATDYSLASVMGKTESAHAVWLITGTSDDLRPTVTKELKKYGFHIQKRWALTRTDVVRYER